MLFIAVSRKACCGHSKQAVGIWHLAFGGAHTCSLAVIGETLIQSKVVIAALEALRHPKHKCQMPNANC
jgi:hypothetical protein